MSTTLKHPRILKHPRKTNHTMANRPNANENQALSTFPQYTVKEVSDRMGLTIYAIRHYDKLNLFPYLQRTEDGTRLFSDYDLEWVKIVHCLRCTGLSLEEIKHYVDLCLSGDDTIPERAAIIFRQEENLKNNIRELQEQLKMLQKKKAYFQALMENGNIYDPCNPQKKKKH